MTNKTDKATLARLERVAAQQVEAATVALALRARRDFLIVAAYRRGLSVRAIARAAGIHPSRVSQLVAEAARVADESHLQPIRPAKRARKQTDG